MTTQEINRKLHEALGKCCKHQWFYWSAMELHQHAGEYQCSKCHVSKEEVNYPDYCADPRLVIEAMRKREDYNHFLFWAWHKDKTTLITLYDLILDQTGKLARLALEWLEGREVKG